MWNAHLKRERLLDVSAVLLAGQLGVLGGMVQKGHGGASVVKLTPLTRDYTKAAALLAGYLIDSVCELHPRAAVPAPAGGVSLADQEAAA